MKNINKKSRIWKPDLKKILNSFTYFNVNR